MENNWILVLKSRVTSGVSLVVSQFRSLHWGISVGAISIFLFSVVMGFNLNRHNAKIQAQRNSYFAIATTEDAIQALLKMEAANRGFLLTGDNDFRTNFQSDVDILSSRYQELLKLTVKDPEQQERLKEFKVRLTQWFQNYAPTIRHRRENSVATLIDTGMSRDDQANILKCKALFEEMLNLLDEIRTAQAGDSWVE